MNALTNPENDSTGQPQGVAPTKSNSFCALCALCGQLSESESLHFVIFSHFAVNHPIPNLFRLRLCRAALKELLADGTLPFSALLKLTVRGVNRGQKIVEPWHDVVAAVVPAHRTRL